MLWVMRYLVPEDLNGHARQAVREMAMTGLVRVAITTAAAGLDRNLNRSAYTRGRWGDEAAAVNTILRAASAPATTAQAGWTKGNWRPPPAHS
jgi:hypothetical protein